MKGWIGGGISISILLARAKLLSTISARLSKSTWISNASHRAGDPDRHNSSSRTSLFPSANERLADRHPTHSRVLARVLALLSATTIIRAQPSGARPTMPRGRNSPNSKGLSLPCAFQMTDRQHHSSSHAMFLF